MVYYDRPGIARAPVCCERMECFHPMETIMLTLLILQAFKELVREIKK
jgi:hypothetical protein